MTRRLLSTLLVLAVLSTALVRGSAAAEIQKSGPETFPGKFAVGAYPLAFQVPFEDRSTGGYKFLLDFAALLASPGKLSVWLGGEFYYAHPSFSGNLNGGTGHDIGFGVFVRLTLEKIMRIPLVPFVQAGLDGDILVFPNGNIGGGIPLRVGGGIHYYLLKNLGLGAYTTFAFGPGIYPVAATRPCGTASTCVGFLGNWDFGLGAVFHF